MREDGESGKERRGSGPGQYEASDGDGEGRVSECKGAEEYETERRARVSSQCQLLTQVIVHGGAVVKEKAMSCCENNIATNERTTASVRLGPVACVAHERELDDPLVASRTAHVDACIV